MEKKQVLKGIISANLGGFVNRGIQFITRLVLARLLLPEEFGIVALALIFINFFGLINGLGIEVALIHKKKNFEKLVGSAFSLVSLTGLVLFILMFLSSKLISVFYQTPEVDLVIKVLALILIIYPLKVIPSSLLNIKFKFHKLVISEIGSNLIFALITIFLAILGFSYWSIVIGYVISGIVHTLLLWIFMPWKPWINFNFSDIKELISYGKHISIGSVVSFLITQGDDLFIGKLLGISALGFYVLAFTISDLTMANISHSIARVAFPTYSNLQENKERLKKAFVKHAELISFLILPLLLIIFIFGNEIINFVFGSKWLPMVLTMQILCFHGFLRAMHINSSMLLNAIGKPKTNQNILILELFIMAGLLYPFAKSFGIAGVAVAITIARFFGFYITTFKVMNEIGMNCFYLLKNLYHQFIAVILLGGLIFFLTLLIPVKSLVVLIAYILFTGFAYIIFNLLLNKNFVSDFKFVISTIRGFKK